jgi:hypothetical protein
VSGEVNGRTPAEELQQFKTLLGTATFHRIQREVWKRFSPKAPPLNSQGDLAPLALFGIWDQLILALREASKRQAYEKESATPNASISGPLWELNKNGVLWTATIRFRVEGQWEVAIIRNGQRAQVQQFGSRKQADAWADNQCIELTMGWKA